MYKASKDFRILLAPGSVNEDISVLKFLHPRTSRPVNFALKGEKLYELKEINGDNPHNKDNHLRPLTKVDSKPVRSLLLENTQTDKPGLAIENSNLILFTRFNFVYLLISYFTKLGISGKESSRYQSLEDFLDALEQEFPETNELPQVIVTDSLREICDSIKEGDDFFYRYSEDKTLKFLHQKVENMAINYPKSISEKLIKPTLYPIDVNETIPDNITSSASRKFSIYLLSSYLLPEIESKLLARFDFSELDQYVSMVTQARKEKKLAQEQLQSINVINRSNKKSSRQNEEGPARKKATISKNLAKPKIQRGPLDAFLGRKK